MRSCAAKVYRSASAPSMTLSSRSYSVNAQWTSRRCFQSQSYRFAQAAAARATPAAEAQTTNADRPATLDAKDRDILNKGLDNTASVGTNHTSRHKTPSAQQTTPNTPSSILFPSAPASSSKSTAGGSFADLQREFTRSQPQTPNRPNPILFPQSSTASTFGSRPTETLQPPKLSNIPYQSLHLTTRKGKTLDVIPTNPTDLGSKLRQLGAVIARNRIRQDVTRQKFHERPGLKRKRLVSERWRRRFKEGFGAMVGRVQVLRRQGW